jgi:hypothetical protein
MTQITHQFAVILWVSVLDSCQRRGSTRMCLIRQGSDIARVIGVWPLGRKQHVGTIATSGVVDSYHSLKACAEAGTS